jgi:hypothetical protein
LIGVVLFSLLIISLLVYIFKPRGEPVAIQKTDALFGILNDGDIICRFGDRLWSLLFMDISVSDKRYSHVGIVRIKDSQISVIHSEGSTTLGTDFVKSENIEDFIKTARAVGIYRVKRLNGDLISNAAIEYLGMPFDWQFDMEDDSKLYCTELLYVVLKRLSPTLKLNTIYINTLNKNIIPLESISNSEHFTEIFCSR